MGGALVKVEKGIKKGSAPVKVGEGIRKGKELWQCPCKGRKED
jgi:hypothetical protein